jgi:hypothetical protein
MSHDYVSRKELVAALNLAADLTDAAGNHGGAALRSVALGLATPAQSETEDPFPHIDLLPCANCSDEPMASTTPRAPNPSPSRG